MGRDTLNELRARSHRKLLDLRSVDRMVNSHDFERVWKTDPNGIAKLVINGDRAGLHKVMILKVWTVEDLRNKCRRRGVKNYSRMSREELEQNVYRIQRELHGDEQRNTN